MRIGPHVFRPLELEQPPQNGTYQTRLVLHAVSPKCQSIATALTRSQATFQHNSLPAACLSGIFSEQSTAFQTLPSPRDSLYRTSCTPRRRGVISQRLIWYIFPRRNASSRDKDGLSIKRLPSRLLGEG